MVFHAWHRDGAPESAGAASDAPASAGAASGPPASEAHETEGSESEELGEPEGSESSEPSPGPLSDIEGTNDDGYDVAEDVLCVEGDSQREGSDEDDPSSVVNCPSPTEIPVPIHPPKASASFPPPKPAGAEPAKKIARISTLGKEGIASAPWRNEQRNQQLQQSARNWMKRSKAPSKAPTLEIVAGGISDGVDPRIQSRLQKTPRRAETQSAAQVPPLLAFIDWEKKIADAAANDGSDSVITPIDVPQDYGNWPDWNADSAVLHEQALSDLHGLRFWMRGPVGPQDGGPMVWKGIPWDYKKGCWGFTSREQLPREYSFQDWWSEEALRDEQEIAMRYHIPWGLRGPPNGPDTRRGLFLWRSRKWRANTRMWMNSGGGGKDCRQAKFGKSSKNKGKGNARGKGRGGGCASGKGKGKGRKKA